MSNTLTVIITGVATGLIVASIVAIINIKIKYAQSETQAKRAVVLIFWKIIYGASLLCIALVLIKELKSTETLTRSSLITILLCSFSLFNSFMAYLFQRVARILERNLSMFEMGGYIDRKLLEFIAGLPCQPKNQPQPGEAGKTVVTPKSIAG